MLHAGMGRRHPVEQDHQTGSGKALTNGNSLLGWRMRVLAPVEQDHQTGSGKAPTNRSSLLGWRMRGHKYG